jgi:hypothetical protein
MTKITQTSLVQLGRHAAETYDECDTALTQLNEGFGVAYESARQNLSDDINTAVCQQGMDLSVFSGKSSLFKYEEFRTNIVVKVTQLPTEHEKLLKMDAKIEQLQKQLAKAKLQRKQLIQMLALDNQIDFTTDKVTLAFTRIK